MEVTAIEAYFHCPFLYPCKINGVKDVFPSTQLNQAIVFKPLKHFCDDDYFNFFFTSPLEDVHPSQKNSLVIGGQAMVSFALKVADETIGGKCVDKISAIACARTCLERKLVPQLNCRLPFIPKTIQLPNCNSSKEAKRTRTIFLDATLSLREQCACQQECVKPIYEVMIKPTNIVKNNVLTLVGVLIERGIVYNFVQDLSVSLVSLVCQVGNLFGFWLGLCILSLMELFQEIVVLFKASRK